MKGLKSFRRLNQRPGSALVITLAIIVLATVIALGYLAGVTLESKTARTLLDEQKAVAMADYGLNAALGCIRDALGPWDNPYANFCASNSAPPTFYWSMSPGRITRWSYTEVNPQSNFALFSEASTTNLVNLNRQQSDGGYPIIGGASAPDVSVKWVNVLANPTQPASATNAVIGRYAFWVDDESAKINLNVADGTEKTNMAKSLGVGTLTEVSLQALSQGGMSLPSSVASNIVQIARTGGLHSPREILRADGTSPDLYTNNVFNLTVASRSPDLNVFGQPKIPLIPGYRSPTVATNLFTNGITLQPVREIHPGYEQLPRITFKAVSISKTGVMNLNTYANRHWPTVFQQINGGASDFGAGTDNDPVCNGWLIANYLAGTNALGKAITWPAFPGSQATNFLGKYSARQIDSVALQVVDLAAKATSPDYVYPGSATSLVGVRTAPSVGFGWLSSQMVSGIGRSPKVTKILMQFTAQAGITTNQPPALRGTAYIEWWLPARFQGTSLFHKQNPNNSMLMGNFVQNNYLNAQDLAWRGNTGTNISGTNIMVYTNSAAPLPRQDMALNYWGDVLLRNNQGIDFAGNASSQDDPDQDKAQAYHGFAQGTNGRYAGAGPGFPLMRMQAMTLGNQASPVNDWAPGEFRCIRNYSPASSYLMTTNAPGTMLEIRGGIAVLAQLQSGRISEVDPAPLEAVRGSQYPGNGVTSTDLNVCRTLETFSSSSVYQRTADSVIPISASVRVPDNDTFAANSIWVYAKVKSDPLVNKFPGDWDSAASTNVPSTTMNYAGAGSSWASYSESQATMATATDPDSYWMPTVDSFYGNGESPVIPRSARFPSLGYLQYVRTGIIPDDESGALATQHGTPFRLLSFAPSTESANQSSTQAGSLSYPDWAMLDLFYIPSTLAPLGGAFGTSTNLLYYGTFGGATSGRVNPNGSVIYTTNVAVPQANVARNIPMQAALRGLRVNQSLIGGPTLLAPDFTGPSLNNGTAVDEKEIARAIEDYLRTNGPLRMPAEICNIPEIAALRPTVNATRNDLVRQVVGELTTQSNVFSVWVAGQALQKKPGNTSYDQFETGDSVLSEVRMHFVIERYLDPGADGVYGNAASPGPDGIVGTLDDLADPTNNPPSPRYLYRVIFSERVQG